MVGSCQVYNYKTWAELNNGEKHSSLLLHCNRKKVYNSCGKCALRLCLKASLSAINKRDFLAVKMRPFENISTEIALSIDCVNTPLNG
jgi:hypothetical protein